jgi:glycosyltransferase involved in cell wall biosynthesis
MMRYAFADVEITRPLPPLSLAEGECGVALLLRRDDRPIHFSLHELPPGARLDSDAFGQLIARAAAGSLLEDSLCRELTTSVVDAAPLRLTVAVCTRDRCELLADCLRGLITIRPEDSEDPRHFELIVVDNYPSDATTQDLVGSLPNVQYVREPIPGLDFARNRALACATGDFVAFLDDDVVVDRGWLGGLEEAVAESPDAAAVTGLVLPYGLDSEAQIIFEQRGGFRRGFRKLRYEGQTLPDKPLYPAAAGIFGAGCNMVLRRDVVTALGGFDEALDTGPSLPGGGDLDIFHRIVRADHALVYEPRMLVFHKHRRELGALRRQYWSWGEGFIAFVEKTYRADPTQRSKLRRLVGWWLKDQLGTLHRSLRARDPRSPDLVMAELIGGVVGLTGSYRRSRRRVEGLRRNARA